MPPETLGTEFAPQQPDEGSDANLGKKGAGTPAISSGSEIPPYAAPVSVCLRFVPDRLGTHFSVQIIDLATGHVLDEHPPQQLAELPAALAHVRRWVFCR